MPALTSAAADALWRARSERRTVDPADGAWSQLGPSQASEVADELYRRVFDGEPSAWKLGAVDQPTQQRLGLTGPLVAPVLPDGLHEGAREVRLRREDFVQPRLEAEVGVRIDSAGLRPMPCVEVADSRLAGWRLPPAVAVADFGLQGAMVFGAAGELLDVVHVEVRHDGRLVQTAELSWAEAVGRLDLLPPGVTDRPVSVATGAMAALLDAAPGRWQFDFPGLSTLTLLIS